MTVPQPYSTKRQASRGPQIPRFHRVVHVAVRDVVPGPGRIPALVSDPVQLSLTLLQRLKRAILLQGDHDRLDLACPEDHLMVGDLSIERQGAITHAYESTPKRNVGQYPTSSLATRPANCNARAPDSRAAPNPRSLTASRGFGPRPGRRDHRLRPAPQNCPVQPRSGRLNRGNPGRITGLHCYLPTGHIGLCL